MMLLFGIALRRTNESDQSKLLLIGLAWTVTAFITLRRCQRTFSVNRLHRGRRLDAAPQWFFDLTEAPKHLELQSFDIGRLPSGSN